MAKLKILLALIFNAEYALSQFFNYTDDIQNPCPIESRVNLTGEIPDASGFVSQLGYVFPPDSLWIKDGEIFGCICYDRPICMPLACPIGSVIYYRIDFNCVELFDGTDDSVSINAPPPLIYGVGVPIENSTVNHMDADYIDYAYGNCSWVGNDSLIIALLRNDGCVRTENSVYIPQNESISMYNYDSYCLCKGFDSKNDRPNWNFRGIFYTMIKSYVKDTDKESDGVTMATHVGIIISIPFLLVTLVVYSILPEMKNIHGLTLSGYVGCLLVGYIILAVIQTVGPISDLPCLFFAFTIHFSFLASFFWLNVMCFDIWWTFGGFRSVGGGKIEKGDNKKSLKYSIYALGCASLLAGVCMIMDLAPGVPDTLIRPEFGVESNCWFKTDAAIALYFYGPMGIIVTCNIYFFVSTAIKIIQHKRTTERHLKGLDSKRHDDNRQWFNLYLKLFIVMGINWSMEIISWLYKDLEYLWYVTDLANALQGPIIFAIFICKKKILRLLVKRFGCQMPNFLSQDSTKSGNRTSASETVTTSVSRSA